MVTDSVPPPQVNRVAVWHYNPAASPSPASSLVEPQCVCELAVAGDVMDMQFLDEERILVGLSTGSAVLLHYRPSHQVPHCLLPPPPPASVPPALDELPYTLHLSPLPVHHDVSAVGPATLHQQSSTSSLYCGCYQWCYHSNRGRGWSHKRSSSGQPHPPENDRYSSGSFLTGPPTSYIAASVARMIEHWPRNQEVVG